MDGGGLLKEIVEIKETWMGNKISEGYNWDTYMKPVWESGTIYYESITFYPNVVNGYIEPAPLLYMPRKILGVYSDNFHIEYIEGVDFKVEKKEIIRTEQSRVPIWNYDSWYLKSPSNIPITVQSVPDRFVMYDECGRYAEKQLLVTYECEQEEIWTGIIPKYNDNLLPNFQMKLEQGKPITIVYYGDSIMAGCDCSGMRKRPPYMPIFTEMVTEGLKRIYHHLGIKEVNSAVGGTTTEWGVKNIKERVTPYQPDLVVIGFGMNDSGKNITLDDYEINNLRMVNLVRDYCPKAEFLFISPILPNPECKGWTKWQGIYQKALESIVKNTKGTALVPMTDIYNYLLSKKRYPDIQGNGVNHPNDYLYRIYAQAVLATLISKQTC